MDTKIFKIEKDIKLMDFIFKYKVVLSDIIFAKSITNGEIKKGNMVAIKKFYNNAVILLPGMTLNNIANTYNVDLDIIKRINKTQNGYIGQIIVF